MTAKEVVTGGEHGHHDDGPKPEYMHVSSSSSSGFVVVVVAVVVVIVVRK